MFKRIVGSRQEPVITMDANSESLLQGCHFNDEMHKFFKINGSGIKKGIYRFRTHEEANEHQAECLAEAMAVLKAKR